MANCWPNSLLKWEIVCVCARLKTFSAKFAIKLATNGKKYAFISEIYANRVQAAEGNNFLWNASVLSKLNAVLGEIMVRSTNPFHCKDDLFS